VPALYPEKAAMETPLSWRCMYGNKRKDDVAFNLMLTMLARLNRLSFAIDVFAGVWISAQVKDVYFIPVCPAIHTSFNWRITRMKSIYTAWPLV
jgi:hypothetical protein